MSDHSIIRRSVLLCAVIALLALIAACGWASVRAIEVDHDTFFLPQASDIQRTRLAIGTQRITYTYTGRRGDQRAWMLKWTRARGWQRSTFLEDCSGRCSEENRRIYVRRLFFGLVRDIAMIDQTGDGPFRVRIVLRRCVRLPQGGCWP